MQDGASDINNSLARTENGQQRCREARFDKDCLFRSGGIESGITWRIGMARRKRTTPRGKDFTLAFYMADNWVRMKWIGAKLAELRSKLKDNEPAEVADNFNVIERQFDRMYNKVGEEIWVINENLPPIPSEICPSAIKTGAEQREDSFQIIRSIAQKISRPLRNAAISFVPKGYVYINVRTF